MKERFGKKEIIVLSVFLLVLLACILFSCMKSGMFIDEIYTYGLSNGYYTPYISDIKDGSVLNKTFTDSDLLAYVTAEDADAFRPGSVFFNQAQDVHPPLYYLFVHFLSSVCRGSFSKWIGLSLNILFYLIALIFLYRTSEELFSSGWIALAVTVLYGLSTVGLSTVLLIRMYTLSMMLSVILTRLAVKYLKGGGIGLTVGIGLTIYFGLLTHYYFVFYAAFLCASCLIGLILQKEYRRMIPLAGFALLGVGAMLLTFPSLFTQLSADKLVSGGTAVEKLSKVSKWFFAVRDYGYNASVGMPLAVLLSVAVLVYLIVKRREVFQNPEREPVSLFPLYVLIPAVLAFAVSAVVSPVWTVRYVYNVLPIFCLIPGYLLYMAFGRKQDAENVPKKALVFLAGTVLASALVLIPLKPDYLYLETPGQIEKLEEHGDCPCLYITDDSFATLTEDLEHLLAFRDFFVTDDPKSPEAAAYLKEKGDPAEIIVFINTDTAWTNGMDAQKVLKGVAEATGCSVQEKLFDLDMSEVYCCRKPA